MSTQYVFSVFRAFLIVLGVLSFSFQVLLHNVFSFYMGLFHSRITPWILLALFLYCKTLTLLNFKGKNELSGINSGIKRLCYFLVTSCPCLNLHTLLIFELVNSLICCRCHDQRKRVLPCHETIRQLNKRTCHVWGLGQGEDSQLFPSSSGNSQLLPPSSVNSQLLRLFQVLVSFSPIVQVVVSFS